MADKPVQIELTNVTKEIYQSSKDLRDGAKKLFTYAKSKAETEREYRKALSIEMMKLRNEGLPATLIPDIARGNLSDLRYKRDLAKATYDSARDAIEALKAEINSLQTICHYQDEI